MKSTNPSPRCWPYTQAAGRLLAEDPPDLDMARNAMTVAAQQARRAADLLAGRLRRAVQRPDPAAQLQPVVLQDAVRNALYLLRRLSSSAARSQARSMRRLSP